MGAQARNLIQNTLEERKTEGAINFCDVLRARKQLAKIHDPEVASPSRTSADKNVTFFEQTSQESSDRAVTAMKKLASKRSPKTTLGAVMKKVGLKRKG